MDHRPLVKNAISVDVEDYFQVSNFERQVSRGTWEYLPVRVEENVRRVLELFERHQVRATFFVLGWVAERFGRLVRSIREAGHEIGSHGYGHRIAYELTPEQFREDLRRSKQVIEDAIGAPVEGYRATSFSIVRRNFSYLGILAEEGFSYDSSIFPVHHNRYGIPGWDRFPSLVREDGFSIYEFPPSTYRFPGYNLPMAGGGYLRLLPAQLIAFCIERINRESRQPAVLYFHPWELDAGQPRIKGSLLSNFRHYNNLARTERKLSYLLERFSFCPMRELIRPAGEAL